MPRKTSDCAICGKPNATFTIFTPDGPPEGLKETGPGILMVHKKCVKETEDKYHWHDNCEVLGNVCIWRKAEHPDWVTVLECCGSCEFFVPGGLGIEGTEGLEGWCYTHKTEMCEGDAPFTSTCYNEV